MQRQISLDNVVQKICGLYIMYIYGNVYINYVTITSNHTDFQ
jgi:hypothetical protein